MLGAILKRRRFIGKEKQDKETTETTPEKPENVNNESAVENIEDTKDTQVVSASIEGPITGNDEASGTIETIQEPTVESPEMPVETEAADKKQEGETGLTGLFTDIVQEEESGLGALLELAPNVTMPELMNNLREIKEMLRGRLEEQENE